MNEFSSQSTTASQRDPTTFTTWDILRRQRETVRTLKEVIVPASREASPTSEQRVATIKQALRKSQARNKRNVGSLLFLACSRLQGPYVGASKWGLQASVKIEPSQPGQLQFATDEEEKLESKKWEAERIQRGFKPRPPPGSLLKSDLGRKRNKNPSSSSENAKAVGNSPTKRLKTGNPISPQRKTSTLMASTSTESNQEVDVFTDGASMAEPTFAIRKGKARVDMIDDNRVPAVSVEVHTSPSRRPATPISNGGDSYPILSPRDRVVSEQHGVTNTSIEDFPTAASVEQVQDVPIVSTGTHADVHTPRRGAFDPELSEDFVPPSFVDNVFTSTPVSVPRRTKAKPLPIPIHQPSPHLSTPPSSPLADIRPSHTDQEPLASTSMQHDYAPIYVDPVERSRTFPMFGLVVDDVQTPPDLFSQPITAMHDYLQGPTTPKKNDMREDPLISPSQRAAIGLKKLPTLDQLLTASGKKKVKGRLKSKQKMAESPERDTRLEKHALSGVANVEEDVFFVQPALADHITIEPEQLTPRRARLSLPSPSPSDERESGRPDHVQDKKATSPVATEEQASRDHEDQDLVPDLVPRAGEISTAKTSPGAEVIQRSPPRVPSLGSDLYDSQFDLDANVDAISGFLGEEDTWIY